MRTLALAAACLGIVACDKMGRGGSSLATSADSVSYVVGFQIGGNLKAQGIPANEGPFLRGLRDALAGTPPTMTQDQMRLAVTNYQQGQVATAAADESKFLAENAKKEGVNATASGLQWKVVNEGKGPRPKATSEATVHYKGTLINGTPFDSSYGGPPATFSLTQVIPGWSEAVQLMTAGAKYQIWIPAKLGYGEAGQPPAIGPNQVLVFDIELISFK